MRPFILHCFSRSSSLIGERKGEKSLKKHQWIVTAYSYLLHPLMSKCMCTWLHHPLKLLISTVSLPCTDSSQPWWFHVETYICMFLGCDLPIQLLLKWLSSTYNNRLADRFYNIRFTLPTIQTMQHFMLEQIDLVIFLPVIYQYSSFIL